MIVESATRADLTSAWTAPATLSLSSAAPWEIRCVIEPFGRDYLCRIRRGERPIGAAALAQWRDGRAVTECLTTGAREEASIATHAAHRLCGAARRSVLCVVGVHDRDAPRAEVEALVQRAHELARAAAGEIEVRRIRQDLAAPSGPYARIRSVAAQLSRDVDAHLATPLEALLPRVVPRVRAEYAENFGNKVWIFAPLYLSSACTNDCAYCGFRRSARFRRTTLTVEQALREARHLAQQGHRTIDLVTGEVPTDRFVDYVCEVVVRVLRDSGIRRVNLNLGALAPEQYRRLKDAGATGYRLYQETYDPRIYLDLHAGIKRDMASRLEAASHIVAAGFENIGLGVLVGLRALGEDLAWLVGHARVL